MRFLQIWDKANVIKISKQQFEKLKAKKIINQHNIQKYDEYIIEAKCFLAKNGDIYVSREKKILNALNE